MNRRSLVRRCLIGGAGATAVLLLTASTATAGPLVEEAGGCTEQQLSKPFARWVDPMQYTPVVNSGLEQGEKGWKLSGGAGRVAGNEPWNVAGDDDGHALSLPAGSRATTAPICVGLAEPTLRFFARRTSGMLSTLLVEVLFEDATGTVRALPIGADLGGSWHPTMVMPVVANLLPLLPGEQTAVAFRFTPLGEGDWEIDDVYVDPWCMR